MLVCGSDFCFLYQFNFPFLYLLWKGLDNYLFGYQALEHYLESDGLRDLYRNHDFLHLDFHLAFTHGEDASIHETNLYLS